MSAPTLDLSEFDPASFTLNEMIEFKSITGLNITAAFDSEDEMPEPEEMRALAYILAKRDNPDISIEDVGDTTLGQLGLVGDDDAQDA